MIKYLNNKRLGVHITLLVHSLKITKCLANSVTLKQEECRMFSSPCDETQCTTQLLPKQRYVVHGEKPSVPFIVLLSV